MFHKKSESIVNINYQYEDNDMIGILKIKIRELNLPFIYNADYPVGTTAMSLKYYLEDERREHNGARTLLIPYNIGGYHWIGLLLAINAAGKVTEIISLDSLGKGEHSRSIVSAAIVEATTVYPELKDKVIQVKIGWLQKDVVSCGPLTIENLLLTAKGVELPNRDIQPDELEKTRREHVDCYADTDVGFYERQKNNINRVASIQQQQQWLSTAGTHFTLFELRRITEIIELLQQLENTPIQKEILDVFSMQVESHQEHLNNVRQKLMEIRTRLGSQSKEEEIFYQLIKTLFDLDQAEAEKSNFEEHYKIPYEGFSVIVNNIHASVDELSQTRVSIQKQIEEDEKLARALQLQLWQEDVSLSGIKKGALPSNKKRSDGDNSHTSSLNTAQSALLSLIKKIRKSTEDFENSLKDFQDAAIQKQLKNLPARIKKSLERIEKLISQKSELKRTLEEEIKQIQTFIESKIGFIESESTNYSEKIQSIELLGKITNQYMVLSQTLNPQPIIEEQSDSRWRDERLRLEQQLVCKEPQIKQLLDQLLDGLREMAEINFSMPNQCFISYAWASEPHEKWIQPFLSYLREHLKSAGINATQDIKDNPPGGNIYQYMSQVETVNCVIVVGTESLMKKHASGTHAICNELILINRRRAKSQGKTLPILLSGDFVTALPPYFSMYTTVRDWREKSYMANLKTILASIYGIGSDNVEYNGLWKPFEVGEYAVLMRGLEQTVVEEQLKAERAKQAEQTVLDAEQATKWFESIKYSQFNIRRSMVSTDESTDWNSPEFEEYYFVGQKKYLDKLSERFRSTEKNRTTKTVLTGWKGVGKTYLAKYYFCHSLVQYKHKLWFSASSRIELVAQYIQFGKEHGLFGDDDCFSEKNKIENVKNFLMGYPGWLIVYDNAENKKILSEFLPSKGGHLLITSINPDDWPKEQKIVVEVMNDEDALELIQREVEFNVENDIFSQELFKLLGNLPLALAQAGSYMNVCQISIERYISEYKRRRKEILSDDTLSQRLEVKPLYITWDMNMAAITESARDLLTLCAYLNSNDIPRKAIEENLATLEDIKILRRFSLIKANQQFLFIHQIIQEVIREKQSQKNKTNYYLNKALVFLNENFNYDKDDSQAVEDARLLMPHMRRADEVFEEDLKNLNTQTKKNFGELLYNLGSFYLQSLQNNDEAERILLKAIQYIGNGEENSKLLSNCYRLLAKACMFIKKSDRARTYLSKSNEIYKRNDVDVLCDKGNLYLWEVKYIKQPTINSTSSGELGAGKTVLIPAGKPSKQASLSHAIDCFKDALKLINVNLNNSENIVLLKKKAMILHYLGTCNMYSKDYSAAIESYEESLNIKQQVYEKTHIEVARTLHNIAICEFRSKLSSSKETAEKSLEIKKNFYKMNKNTDVLKTLTLLSMIHNNTNFEVSRERKLIELEKLENLFKEMLIIEHILKKRNTTRYKLVKVYLKQARILISQEKLEQAKKELDCFIESHQKDKKALSLRQELNNPLENFWKLENESENHLDSDLEDAEMLEEEILSENNTRSDVVVSQGCSSVSGKKRPSGTEDVETDISEEKIGKNKKVQKTLGQSMPAQENPNQDSFCQDWKEKFIQANALYAQGKTSVVLEKKRQANTFFLQAKDLYKVVKQNGVDKDKEKAEKRFNKIKSGKYSASVLLS